MKNRILFTLILSIFTLISILDAAEAAQVYVIGSPTDLPKYNKKLRVKVKVINRPTYGYLLISLRDVSNMNGYCTNAPVNSSDRSADLKLLLADNSGSRWSDQGSGVLKFELPASYISNQTFDLTVNVRCYDYGAYGKLKATLYERIGENRYRKAGEGIGTVPRDENGNHIADAWRNDFYPYVYSNATTEQVHYGKTKAQKKDGKPVVKDYPYSVPFFGKRQNTVDKETGPYVNNKNVNTENGDGFTVFEEYRGFMTEQYAGYGGGPAGHIRLNPEKKDVFTSYTTPCHLTVSVMQEITHSRSAKCTRFVSINLLQRSGIIHILDTSTFQTRLGGSTPTPMASLIPSMAMHSEYGHQ